MSLYDFSVQTIDGQERSLRDYAGKVVLVVNVASQCGLTPHYAGLQELYESFGDRGLVVLGFPCNQFGAQEPGSESADQDVLRDALRGHLPDVRQDRRQRRRRATRCTRS